MGHASRPALTCSARLGVQAQTAAQARRMRLESPASPPTLSHEYAGEGADMLPLPDRKSVCRERV